MIRVDIDIAKSGFFDIGRLDLVLQLKWMAASAEQILLSEEEQWTALRVFGIQHHRPLATRQVRP